MRPIKVAEVDLTDLSILFTEETKCDILIGHYAQGGAAIMIQTTETQEPVATFTRYIRPVAPYHVLIDTNNNPKALEILIKNGVVKPQLLDNVPSGYCIYPEFELSDMVIEKLKNYTDYV